MSYFHSMNSTLLLPQELEPFRRDILTTQTAFVEIIPYEAGKTDWWQSKIGGLPYLPHTVPFPTAPNGRELFFLAQINFEEVPAFEQFPESGILQFYVADDTKFGKNTKLPELQEKFRVLYFAEPDRNINHLTTDFKFLPKYKTTPVKPNISYPIEFEIYEEMMPISDHQFAQTFGNQFFKQFGDRQYELQLEYAEEISSAGHKMGGYADFAGEDPRPCDADEPMLLLFQLDSDAEIGCHWGDFGVANFFIRPSDLEKRDFSKVLYHWEAQ